LTFCAIQIHLLTYLHEPTADINQSIIRLLRQMAAQRIDYNENVIQGTIKN